MISTNQSAVSLRIWTNERSPLCLLFPDCRGDGGEAEVERELFYRLAAPADQREVEDQVWGGVDREQGVQLSTD